MSTQNTVADLFSTWDRAALRQTIKQAEACIACHGHDVAAALRTAEDFAYGNVSLNSSSLWTPVARVLAAVQNGYLLH